MREDSQDFGDLIQMTGEEELTRIVMEAKALQDAPAHARCIAAILLELRDGGDRDDRRLAVKSIGEYFRLWLRRRPNEDLRGRVECH